MKICVIGTGYVGLVAGTCLAEMGNDVVCVDKDTNKIEKLKNGVVPIYEPGLEELMKANVSEGRLFFSTDLKTAVEKSSVLFVAVGTPQRDDGSCDLSAVYGVAKEIAGYMNGYKVVVNKSTVPVGTADATRKIITSATDEEFDVVSNPEFLKQGAAVDDFLKPDRVIIGSDSPRATEMMQELYNPFLRTGNPVIVMDVKSAEMTKYAANSFLATKISFINEVANLCEKLGADVENVRVGMSSDKRIGSQFLFPGLGYGGSCFPKDVKALVNTAKENKMDMNILNSVDETNKNQRAVFVNKVLNYFNGDVRGKTFAVWGLAFKPRTNDMREAPAIDIISALLVKGAKIQAYDPKAMELAQTIFGDKICYAKNRYDAIKNTDGLLLLTEWNEFRRPDFETLKESMKTHVVFDGRNQYNSSRLNRLGFDYVCMGKNAEMADAKVSLK